MDVAQLITNIGFPIFSFLLCGTALKYVYDRERTSLDGTIAKITDLTQAVNHNSETISRLVEEVGNTNFEIDREEVHHEGC